MNVSSLRELKNELDALPDSVLNTADVTYAELNEVEDSTFGGYTVNVWYLRLSMEWPVEG